ncbi:hypothetical protein F5Y18DRAFT_334415 [Xylariaceae sp. FL1019]|nr:hypothetical protein F5Y18DRAFT_334415 [Xylariaceae sp. FL1019]
MVYCGKASQGCQSCRTRRIKCDKKLPECSQCIRVGKKCPGYRDQLSLMFRDESSKVIQKAHAQWGNPESPVDGSQASSTPPEQSGWMIHSTSNRTRRSMSTSPFTSVELAKIPRRVEPNLDQRGLQFYMERYLLNHPDSPDVPDLQTKYFGEGDAIQNIMVAVGLAGMSNLLGNKSMNLVARSKYVTALKQTGQLIGSATRGHASVSKPLLSIVTLAMFEVVQGKGSTPAASSANTHINGAIALLRSLLPIPDAPYGGARGVLQLMFSMLIPSHMADMPLSPGYFECLKACKQQLEGSPDQYNVDLCTAIARLMHLLLPVDETAIIDDRPATDDRIQQFLEVERTFDCLDDGLRGVFPFSEHRMESSSPAIFKGRWHKYHEIWRARVWNHFRWARLLLLGRIVEFTSKYPRSSARVIAAPHIARYYGIIQKTAEDILISVPSHWHHPALDNATANRLAAPGQGGTGAAGLPTLLWHLVAAGNAPNVHPDVWDFAHNTLQVVWKDMGMGHALALAEMMEDHRTKLQKEAISLPFLAGDAVDQCDVTTVTR